ncbi:8-oxoguanine DNA glycosylase OGG fold protein [Microvirga arsenatis]|uniref:Uncharacterized protein n=1 Tax=Microvirga arsenatis TaxID=2692265 RepID=A0ABW9Z5G6_9HYPH|nr:hypothetical protein [Microvirga arsenatis]NBJ13873.1 hypothetical protein [Microvirga arsenatis]NBJ27332.1 hypothetical protein [Microvirga arsenatis]
MSSLEVAPGLWFAGDTSLIGNRDNQTLERFHEKLLWSDAPDDRLHGLLSIVYWGYYASADPKRAYNPGRALKKVEHIVGGRVGQQKPSLDMIDAALRTARTAVEDERLDVALAAVMGIQNMGMSFASKVLMFFSPASAAVYDSVIAKKIHALATTNDTWWPLYVNPLSPNTAKKAAAYKQWCGFCGEKAVALNASGTDWSDLGISGQAWRAVDVERSLFAM